MKKYSGFTLIEMLIVMGIIIILMAAGIAGGRFALQRANKIQKQSAVDNIEQALWGYYSDKRKFPDQANPSALLQTGGALNEYIDAGQFDGGADGTFWYFVGTTQQEFVVCTSLGGISDDQELGVYCTGNGLGGDDEVGTLPANSIFGDLAVFPSDNVFPPGDATYVAITAAPGSDWDGENRSW